VLEHEVVAAGLRASPASGAQGARRRADRRNPHAPRDSSRPPWSVRAPPRLCRDGGGKRGAHSRSLVAAVPREGGRRVDEHRGDRAVCRRQRGCRVRRHRASGVARGVTTDPNDPGNWMVRRGEVDRWIATLPEYTSPHCRPNTDNLCVMDPDTGNLDVVVSAPPRRPVNFPRGEQSASDIRAHGAGHHLPDDASPKGPAGRAPGRRGVLNGTWTFPWSPPCRGPQVTLSSLLGCFVTSTRAVFFRDPVMVKQPEAFAVLSGRKQNRHCGAGKLDVRHRHQRGPGA